MTKKFKCFKTDSYDIYWSVRSVSEPDGHYIYAEFYGKHSMQFARAHAKMLNSLPEKDKP